MSDVAQILSALPPGWPWWLTGAMLLSLATIALSERLAGGGPDAALAARLEAVMARETQAAPSAAAAPDADVFNTRRKGLRGAVARFMTDLADSIGGPGALRRLFAIAAVFALAAGVGVASAFGVGALRALATGLGAGLLAFWVVRGEMRRKWMIGFLDQLVEAVELLTRSVRAGYGVPAAIRMVGREIGAPVGPVFARIADEEDLGVSLREALRGAARRVALPDFSFLAIAMVIQRETGGQIGDSLDNLHAVLRKRKEARLKVQALTAEGRTSAMIVGAIPLVAGAGVGALNPEQTALLFSPGLGQTMLGVAVALWITGLLVVRWMVTARP